MDTTYGQAVSLAVPVFLALIAIEFIADRIRGTRYYHFADAVNSLSCGVISTGMRVFFGFLGLFFYERFLRLTPVHLPDNHWATYVFAFILYDFCYYWNHRLGHEVGVLWAAHVVHHQSEEFNLTTALRQTGTGSFLSWIFYIPMALAGVPVGVFLIVSIIQLFYQFWPHTQMIGRMGFLDRWIQTPSNHRVHHAQNDIYLDRNYVGVFVIWDRLFGTFQDELDQEPCIYGIRGQLKSWNPAWANVHYYWAMARDCWYAHSWVDKLRVWIAPPGWRPADVAARFPKPVYDLHRDFSKYEPARSRGLSLYVFVQFVLLIAANSQFLKIMPALPIRVNLLYFAYLTASLVSVGFVLENRILPEAARLTATAAVVMWAGHWFGGTVTAPVITLGCAASLGWFCIAARSEISTRTDRIRHTEA